MPSGSSLRPRVSREGLAAIGGLVLVVTVLVGLSLRRPEVPQYPPTPPGTGEPVGPGQQLLTLDTSDPERWRYVDLAHGVVRDAPTGQDWDLAFRRFEVKVNGGPGFAGAAGVVELGQVPLESVASVPTEGYASMEVAGRDTTLALLDHWYEYSYTTHVLQPRDRTYAIRTARGRYAAFRFLSYYCPEARPACVTIRYAFVEPAAVGG